MQGTPLFFHVLISVIGAGIFVFPAFLVAKWLFFKKLSYKKTFLFSFLTTLVLAGGLTALIRMKPRHQAEKLAEIARLGCVSVEGAGLKSLNRFDEVPFEPGIYRVDMSVMEVEYARGVVVDMVTLTSTDPDKNNSTRFVQKDIVHRLKPIRCPEGA
ncbi:MAG: hypothetical protein AB7O96_15400 [Pseudobdellovibrionaceae bacterium]